MEQSPLTKLAGLGLAAVLVIAMMWLFTLNQVTDTAALQMGTAIDETLARSLDAGAKTRVTVVRDGTGVDAARRYVVRFRPSAAVGADAVAVARLSERAAHIVAGRIDRLAGDIQVHCVAQTSATADAQHCFRVTGSSGNPTLTPVVPVPPLPSEPRPDGAAGERR